MSTDVPSSGSNLTPFAQWANKPTQGKLVESYKTNQNIFKASTKEVTQLLLKQFGENREQLTVQGLEKVYTLCEELKTSSQKSDWIGTRILGSSTKK